MNNLQEAPRSEGQSATIGGYVDELAYFPGYLLFSGWSSFTSAVTTVSFHLDGKPLAHTAIDVVRVSRADLPESVCGMSETIIKSSRLGLVGIARVPDLDDGGWAVGKDCTCMIEFADGQWIEQTTEIGAVDTFDEGLSVINAREADRMPKVGRNDLHSMFLDRWLSGQAMDAPEVFVDKLMAFTEGGIFVRGWAQNAPSRKFAVCDTDFTSLVPVDPICLHDRADVSTFLADSGQLVQNDMHGFMFFVSPAEEMKSLKVIAYTDAELAVSANAQIRDHAPIEQRLMEVLNEMAQFGLPEEEELRPIKDLLDRSCRPPGQLAIDEWSRPPSQAETRPLISIIVPFYGESFFLFDHIEAQSRAPDNVEWIFVCDDPQLTRRMQRVLATRQGCLKQPTRFVAVKENTGFATANNLGVSVARGDYLLFMNSDIYCRDFTPITYAADILARDETYGLLGFSLVFEDETIQHEGMRYERFAAFGNRWICNHPNKGLPAAWTGIDHKEVQAVTGALMLVRREQWTEENIFDPDYVVGDFEDADLCLRVQNAGMKVGLVTAPGIFHLERQSIRGIGAANGRLALTFLNCNLLNRRWGSDIEQLSMRDDLI